MAESPSQLATEMRALIDQRRTVATLLAEHEQTSEVVDESVTTVTDSTAPIAVAQELAALRAQIADMESREKALADILKGMFADKESFVAAGRKIGTYKTEHRVDVNVGWVKENFPASEFPDAYAESQRRVFRLDPSFKGGL